LIVGKKDHDKDKRIIEVIGRYEQLDTVIQEKGSNQDQNYLSDPPQ
jgi:hypothetical protein